MAPGRSRAAGVLALLACVALSAPSFAQSPVGFDRAREHYERGVALLEQGGFADAAQEFDRSVALLERPASVYNLAVACRGAGQHRRAVTVLRRYLALTRERHDDAQALLADSLARVVHVTLRATGDGEEVSVDGLPLDPGNGARELELDPGDHVFEARRRGYEPAREARRYEPGTRTEVALDAAARPQLATLVVETGDRGATVAIDGSVAPRAQDGAPVAAGRHEVEVRFARGETQRRSVEVAPGARLVLSVTPALGGTRPDAAPAPARGVLTRWWFWTGVGAVAAAAVVTTVVLTSHTEEPYRGTWTSSAAQALQVHW